MGLIKKCTFLLLSFLIFQSVYGQQEQPYISSNAAAEEHWINLMYGEDPDPSEVIKAYDNYYAIHPFVKNQHTQYYKRWLKSLSKTLVRSEVQDQIYYQKRSLQNAQRGATTWTPIGPIDWDHDAANRSYAPGAAHVYTIEQAPSNGDILYAGTATAGIWKTTNHGDQWSLLTGDYLSNTCTAITIHPTNPNIIYVELESSVYKSSNGGSTFSPTGNATFQSISMNVKEVRIAPNNSNTILLASDQGFYRSTNAGSTWNLIENGDFLEIEFHPSNPETVYTVKRNGDITEFYRSTNGGTTFTIQTTGWPSPNIAAGEHQQRTEIAVSNAAPNNVYAHATGSANMGSGLYGVYVSTDQGITWTFECCGPQPAGVPSATNMNLMGWSDEGLDDGGQYNYDVAFDVSPTNADSILLGGVNLWVSGNRGSSFTCPSKWSHSYKPNYVHADIHDIKHFDHSNEIWIAGDGGIFYSNDNGANYQRKIYGISGTDFWGYDQGFWFGDVMLGGAYHNGTMLKEEDTYLNGWVCTDGGDGVRGFVHPIIDRQVYSDYNIKNLNGDRNTSPPTRSFDYKPNGTYTTGVSSELLFHPNYQNIYYSGYEDQLILTKDNGYTFEVVHDFDENLAAMAISDSDPDVIYVTTFPGWWDVKHIYKTTDGGSTWTDITPTVPNRAWMPYDIEVDPEDPEHLWIVRTNMYSTPEIDGFSVFESSNGGATWNNISGSGLNGEAPTNIVHQKGSNNALYVGTRRAVYYRDANSSDWTLYSTGLPASTFSLKLRPFYRKQVIRNATNRSVYEIDFKNPNDKVIAMPSVDKATGLCPNDPVQFTDHSIVSEENVSWNWTFEGGTPSTSTERAPIVYYANGGEFNVSLTVSDANGSDTKVMENFIEVEYDCASTAEQNTSLNCLGSNGHMIASGFEANTNNLTITAWIKPSGIQDQYAGIVMNDGDTGGLNFREDNNTIGYHWPGGQWWWDSNLEAPSDEWSYVAMVVSPGGIRIYLNEQEAFHSFEAGPVQFDQIRVGSYKGFSSRNFDGLIDEVCLWNRALTRDEIRLKRHLRKDPNLEEGLFAYYNFDRDGEGAFDLTTNHPGNLQGAANKMMSDLPVANGTSAKQSITTSSAQVLTYAAPGVQLNFSASSNFPNGEIVVSKLEEYPKNKPESKLIDPSYYVINNYGSNITFDNLESIAFNKAGVISNPMLINNFVKLESRMSNAGSAPWQVAINSEMSGSIGNLGSIVFNNASSVNQFGQYILSRGEYMLDSAEVSIIQDNNSTKARLGGGDIQFALQSNNQGFLLPKLSNVDIQTAGSPNQGLLAYHVEEEQIIYFDGLTWRALLLDDIELNGEFNPISNSTGSSLDQANQSKSAVFGLAPSSGFIKLNQVSQNQLPQIATAEEGMLIYNLDLKELQFHDGQSWRTLNSKNSNIQVSGNNTVLVAENGMVIGSSQKDPNAILEFASNSKAFGLPVGNVYEIADPIEGLLLFDENLNCILVHSSNEWKKLLIK